MIPKESLGCKKGLNSISDLATLKSQNPAMQGRHQTKGAHAVCRFRINIFGVYHRQTPQFNCWSSMPLEFITSDP